MSDSDSMVDEDGLILRTFLVVVDESEEMRAALRYACQRARHTGGQVALLHVVPPPEFQHFAGVGRRMMEEARQAAEQTLNVLAAEVFEISGHTAILYVREGKPSDELMALLDEEPAITVLVLAAGTGPDGPGPLISALTGRLSTRLRVPLTIVPGALSDGEIDAVS